MNMRLGCGSTSAGVDLGDNGHGEGIGNTNRESHKAPTSASSSATSTSDDTYGDDGEDAGCSMRVSPCLGDASLGDWWLHPWGP